MFRAGRLWLLSCVLATPSAWAQDHDHHEDEPIVPPKVLEHVEAVLPTGTSTSALGQSSILLVTIDGAGRVAAAEIDRSGGALLDDAALTAIKHWRFRPAMQGGMAIESQIRVTFRFSRPPPKPETLPLPTHSSTVGVGSPPMTPATASPNLVVHNEPSIDVLIHGRRIPPRRAASDFVIEREILSAAPRADAGSLLSTAPGMYVSRPEGQAVAQQVFLRGFDAEHGQDIEFTVAGIPINQVSHLHGQGYSDLNFIPPEVVHSLRVTEGVYDPRQGDFATAGSVDFQLGVHERGFHASTRYGSFGTSRIGLVWAPEGEEEETFGVFTYQNSDGFGQNRGGQSATGMAQYVLYLDDVRMVFHAGAYGARANLAGVLRKDDIDAGRVGFYDAYPFPTAQAQSALSSRFQLGFQLERPGDGESLWSLGLYAVVNNFRLRENFTGFTQQSQINPEFVGRGDLIEQSNQAVTLGFKGSYRSSKFRPLSWVRGQAEVGTSGRIDIIDQQQNLLEAPQNETWDQRVDASINAADIGVFADVDLRLGSITRLRGGLRADALFYDVDDRLGNFIPRSRRQNAIVGFRRTAFGVAMGPRATLEVQPQRRLTLLAAYGQGFRSPQARILEEGESAPFAKVNSAELGARWKIGPGSKPGLLLLTGSGYWTHLSDDLVFDPSEGRLERVGPTTRTGAVAYLTGHPLRWLTGALSFTYVRAILNSPPPPTAANPTPAFQEGQSLPFVPPVVIRADLNVHGPLVTIDERPLQGRLGLGFSYLNARPLPYGEFADPFSVVDVLGTLRYRFLELGVEVYNLLNTQYAAQEFVFVSDWRSEFIPSRIPARHIAAGAPRTVLGFVEVHL